MLRISPTSVSNPQFIELVRHLDAYQSVLYPAESDYSTPLEKMADHEHYPFIAEIGEFAVGCACLFIGHNRLAEIKRVYVNESYRGQNIAAALMATIEAKARQLALPRLYLETGIDHLAAVRFYQKQGFQLTDCFGDYNYDPLSVYMVKPLGSLAPDRARR
ncbi:MAG: GNAT family N-acetyltransferase [Rouxiella aceris]|uniref:GNAT family N-acetyltransferase n=1 Tax=Rouxiella aceris TaxID=2703884 RepID=A0A848MFW5_9GAMM|nr:GNAT family N-acetyltransferase [Rouxiella aceris]MDR3433153.1 GNAT family N-acetyltransferase [Rouxiella aceris]NMP25990.1 GNAT family N-acetyltransferase [Rouxiella aceris]